MYVPRIVDRELDELLPSLPAIALEGTRGVGKTASAARRCTTAFALDDAPIAEAMAAGARDLLSRAAPPVLIDEWQRVPATWDAVRRLVDDDPNQGGRFLLTGSAAPIQPPMHSGAGRIVTMRMRPMTLPERLVEAPTVSLAMLLAGGRPPLAGETTCTLATYADEIAASGFPAIRPHAERARQRLLDSYLRQIVERDLVDAAQTPRGSAATMLAWLRSVAAQSATETSWEKIRGGAAAGSDHGPSRETTRQWERGLLDMWLLDPVPAWRPGTNHLRRLTATSKLHLADPALALRLLGFDANHLLDAASPSLQPTHGTLFGNLFESLAAMSVRVFAQAADATVGHLRVAGGEHEVDLVAIRGDGRVVAIEVKLSGAVDDRDVRHLDWLERRAGDDIIDRIVVTTGPAAYRREDGIGVVPLALLGP